MSDLTFDTSQLDRLAADIGTVARGVSPFLGKALAVTAKRVKDDWNGKLYSDGHADRTSKSITYDVTETGMDFTAEIGAKRGEGRQAGVVRLLENGSVHNGPHGYGRAALEANADDFVTGVSKAVDGLLKGRDL